MICHGFLSKELTAVPTAVLFSMVSADVIDYFTNQAVTEEPSCCICGRQDDLQIVVLYPQMVKGLHSSIKLYFVLTVCSYHYMTELRQDIPNSIGGTSFVNITSPKILSLIDNYCATTLEGKYELVASSS